MDYDFGMLIVRYAEAKARRARRPTWSVVQDILCTGATSSIRFCYQHLPNIGWKLINEYTPDDRLILACESLGDKPTWMARKDDIWYSRKGERLWYKPSWWKES